MKHAPLLLLLLASSAAQAEIYRCEGSEGRVSYQDVACPEPAVEAQAAPEEQITSDEQSATSAEATSMDVSYMDPASYLPGGWTLQQRRQRRYQAKIESRQEAARRQAWQQPVRDRNAAQYAEASHRCRMAKRVAELCGTSGPTFSCTDKGFRSEPLLETSLAPRSDVIGHTSAFSRSQCALQATRGRY